jgi:hypothetical protein
MLTRLVCGGVVFRLEAVRARKMKEAQVRLTALAEATISIAFLCSFAQRSIPLLHVD